VSPRERKYVAGVVNGKTKRKAARDAGFPQSMADNAKQKIEDKPAVKALLTDLLDAAGATDEFIARRIREGLDAMHTKILQRRFPRSLTADAAALQELFEELLLKAESEHKDLAAAIRDAVKEFVHGSELITVDMIAFGERREMVELVLRIKGQLVDKHEVEAGPTLSELLEEACRG
jgi:hypothetical protein